MGCTNSTEATGQRSADKPVSITAATKANGIFKDKYKVGEVLGQGSYSVVKLGTRITDGKKVAVKIVSRHKLQREDELSLRIEVEVLMSLNHPNIVQALDFFEEEECFYVVLEYIEGGELFDRLIEKAVYTEGEARDLFAVLLRAVKYCHDRDLIHRDIKPENILLTSKTDDINLKLADFGFAVKSGVPAAKQQAGTPGYIAPEILLGKPHGKPVDMWSLGVVLYMLLGGYPPFYEPDDDQKTMFRKIVNAEYEFHRENWEGVSSEAQDLVTGLLNLDVKNRLTVDQALVHPWMQKDRKELVLHNLEKNMQALRIFRADHRAAHATVKAGATIAIEVARQLSGSNITKGINMNDVAINVVRKLSGTSLNDAVIEAARKRSGVSLSKNSSDSLPAGSVRSKNK